MAKNEPCLLPWIELHINTLGQLKTCCAQFDYLEENKGLPLKAVFNGERFKSIRAEFLAGRTPKVCEACIQAEANGLSYKTVKAAQWSSYVGEVLDPKNQAQPFPIRFVDLRFGNLCNFACRTCDSDNSSKWQRLDGAVGRHTNTVTRVSQEKFLEQVFGVLDEVEELYMAGGEPLLSEAHYLVLEEIIRRKKTGMKITYNTNLSVLNAFGRDVLDLWKHFDQITLYPSVDSIGEKGEYIRSGFKWGQFEENFQRVKKYIGCLHSVLSVYNVFSIRDLIEWSHKNDSIVSIFPAYHPVEISASVLPEKVRFQAAEKLMSLAADYNLSDWQLSQMKTAADFLKANHTPEHMNKFFKFNGSLDAHHKTDLVKIFPEHAGWMQASVAE